MDKTITVSLSGHTEQFRLVEPAYDRLARYLDRAAARLQGDPDKAEVLRDLERSIGDKLTARLASEDRLVTVADIDSILEEVGAVDTGDDAGAHDDGATQPRKRRLRRIREGQQMAGVCTGLADYAELDVSWVRTIFVFAALFTAGLFFAVYVAMAFILPVSATPAD